MIIPRAHYTMNGLVGGLVPDASGYGHHGTPTDMSWVVGKVGQAASFNGSTSHINAGRLGSLGSNLGAGLTLCAWVKTSQTGLGTIFGWQRTTSNESILLIANYTPTGGAASGALTMDLRDDSNNILRFGVASGSGVNDGNWHHIVAACSPSVAGTPVGVLYVDGEALGISYGYQAQQSNWVDVPVGDWLAVGADHYNSSSLALFLNGQVDDARIYNEVLPAWRAKAIGDFGRGSEECEPGQRLIQPTIQRAIQPLIGA